MITGKQAFKLLKNLVDRNKYIKLSIKVETFEGKSKYLTIGSILDYWKEIGLVKK